MQVIIENINVDVSYKGKYSEEVLKKKVLDFLRNYFLQYLDGLFSKVSIPENTTWEIESLDLELDTKSESAQNIGSSLFLSAESKINELFKQAKERFNSVSEVLKPTHNQTSTNSRIIVKKTFFNCWLDYLNTGRWVFEDEMFTLYDIKNKVFQETEKKKNIIQLQGVLNNHKTWKRLLNLFELKEVESILFRKSELIQIKSQLYELIRLKNKVNVSKERFNNQMLTKIIETYFLEIFAVKSRATKQQKIHQLLKLCFENRNGKINLNKQDDLKTKDEQVVFEEKSEIKNERNGTILTNCGAILLYPFFIPFYIQLELYNSEENEFENPSKAAQILHYVSTGNAFPKDIELGFEKLLFQIPSQEVLEFNDSLMLKEKEICDELFESILNHWSALNNSSPQTIRDLFLKRSARFENKEQIELKFEHQIQDVLIEKLPWGLDFISLPWYKKLWKANWN